MPIRNYLLLTLVLGIGIKVFAAPSHYAPESESDQKVEATQTKDPRMDEMSIAKPVVREEVQSERRLIYYRYKRSISPRLGIVFDQDAIKEDKKLLFNFGFTVLLPTTKGPQWEGGADLISDSTGRFHFGKRWIFNPNDELRPFTKLGLGWRLRGQEMLASFAKKENLQVRGSLGLEDLLADPMSIRVEMEANVGLKTAEFIFNIGYSWAW